MPRIKKISSVTRAKCSVNIGIKSVMKKRWIASEIISPLRRRNVMPLSTRKEDTTTITPSWRSSAVACLLRSKPIASTRLPQVELMRTSSLLKNSTTSRGNSKIITVLATVKIIIGSNVTNKTQLSRQASLPRSEFARPPITG